MATSSASTTSRLGVLSLLLVSLISATALRYKSPSETDVKLQVMSSIEQWNNDMARGDKKAAAKILASEVILMPPGRDAMRLTSKMQREVLMSRFIIAKLKVTVTLEDITLAKVKEHSKTDGSVLQKSNLDKKLDCGCSSLALTSSSYVSVDQSGRTVDVGKIIAVWKPVYKKHAFLGKRMTSDYEWAVSTILWNSDRYNNHSSVNGVDLSRSVESLDLFILPKKLGNVSPTEAMEYVSKAMSGFEEALKSKNPESAANFFAPTASLFPPNVPSLHLYDTSAKISYLKKFTENNLVIQMAPIDLVFLKLLHKKESKEFQSLSNTDDFVFLVRSEYSIKSLSGEVIENGKSIQLWSPSSGITDSSTSSYKLALSAWNLNTRNPPSPETPPSPSTPSTPNTPPARSPPSTPLSPPSHTPPSPSAPHTPPSPSTPHTPPTPSPPSIPQTPPSPSAPHTPLTPPTPSPPTTQTPPPPSTPYALAPTPAESPESITHEAESHPASPSLEDWYITKMLQRHRESGVHSYF